MSAVYDDELEWREVGAVADWPLGSARVVRLGARKIAVVHQQQGWFAFKNGCPHRGLPLVDEGPGSHPLNCEDHTLRCPHHGWPFDLRDGAGPEESCLRTYPVKISGEQVLIGI